MIGRHIKPRWRCPRCSVGVIVRCKAETRLEACAREGGVIRTRFIRLIGVARSFMMATSSGGTRAGGDITRESLWNC